MKNSHGFEKVEYVPEKKSVSLNVKKLNDKMMTIVLISIFILVAFFLFIYPGYFIQLFSETGYQFMN